MYRFNKKIFSDAVFLAVSIFETAFFICKMNIDLLQFIQLQTTNFKLKTSTCLSSKYHLLKITFSFYLVPV